MNGKKIEIQVNENLTVQCTFSEFMEWNISISCEKWMFVPLLLFILPYPIPITDQWTWLNNIWIYDLKLRFLGTVTHLLYWRQMVFFCHKEKSCLFPWSYRILLCWFFFLFQSSDLSTSFFKKFDRLMRIGITHTSKNYFWFCYVFLLFFVDSLRQKWL